MRAKRILGGHLFGDLSRQRRINAAPHIDFGEFVQLKFRVFGQFSALARQVRAFCIGLRTHGHELARRHRHRARNQARSASQYNLRTSRRGGGYAGNQTRGRNNPVVGAKHCGSQPANAIGQVKFSMSTRHQGDLRLQASAGCNMPAPTRALSPPSAKQITEARWRECLCFALR